METILYLEADPRDARNLVAALAGEYRVVHCPEAGSAADAARRSNPDLLVVALDSLGSPRNEVEEAEGLMRLSLASGHAPIIAIADRARSASLGQAIRSAVDEVLPRPCGIGEIRLAVARALRSTARSREASPFVGTSRAIREAWSRLRLFASSEYPVLILGESGTGKELAARSVHGLSARRARPFVDRNCAALPEHLAESELFGTERGAFTDAIARPGAFELAKGGVLFLDEVGEASAPIQAKLLRALESGRFWRLGGKAPVEVDVRLVSATSRELKVPGTYVGFRADLLYRIDTLVLELPPLRARPEDIAPLAEDFALKASDGRIGFRSGALDKLAGHDWPGNVRELRNVVHRALVLAAGSGWIGPEHVVF